MPKGRIPAWLLDPADRTTPRQDVADVDARNRLTVPLRLLDGLSGVDESGAGAILIETIVPGLAVVRPWTPTGDNVLQRRREMAALPEATEAVRALDDAFRRGRLEPGGRFTLPPPVVGHLTASFRRRGLFLVRYDDRLELWSRRYRNEMMVGSLPGFDREGIEQ